MALAAALERAQDVGLDLVEVAPNVSPPVCRIIDYGKYRYQQEKKGKLAKKKQAFVDLKEVWFRPGIEEHDYQVKMKRILRFLEQGCRVKVTVRFRGREMVNPDMGRRLLDRIAIEVAPLGASDRLPKMEGRFLTTFLSAEKKGKK